jgi:hypothetical protein
MAGEATVQAGRLAASGAAIVAGAALADSAIEHYRGSFANRAMVLPLAFSTLELIADTVIAAGGTSRGAGRVGTAVHAAGALTGAAGLAFHTYNISKMAGGLRWSTFFYGAPVGAPASLIVAGAIGAAGQALAGGSARLGPVPLRSGRALAGAGAVSMAGTAAEAALLHFRGAYHNPAMWLPVVLTPVSAMVLARAALTGRFGRITAGALALTAALGLLGSALHAYGVSRNMGGWRNWRQNLLAGPPLPAPPAFTGIALAGLAALLLMKRVRA